MAAANDRGRTDVAGPDKQRHHSRHDRISASHSTCERAIELAAHGKCIYSPEWNTITCSKEPDTVERAAKILLTSLDSLPTCDRIDRPLTDGMTRRIPVMSRMTTSSVWTGHVGSTAVICKSH
ncbi:hypothetical protein L596_021306 [Steinernema carpocapsae]|uniref:Uncharacterized protein n=1 Tax=Steinernema carpocapsae TaxID=34508 RepID=A0A4U5MIA1_STECR|nr:hypothetical protein L596_021306 [Steinernema carpocapsae]